MIFVIVATALEQKITEKELAKKLQGEFLTVKNNVGMRKSRAKKKASLATLKSTQPGTIDYEFVTIDESSAGSTTFQPDQFQQELEQNQDASSLEQWEQVDKFLEDDETGSDSTVVEKSESITFKSATPDQLKQELSLTTTDFNYELAIEAFKKAHPQPPQKNGKKKQKASGKNLKRTQSDVSDESYPSPPKTKRQRAQQKAIPKSQNQVQGKKLKK